MELQTSVNPGNGSIPENTVKVEDIQADVEKDDVDDWDEDYDKIDEDTRKNPIAYAVKMLQKFVIGAYKFLKKLTKGHLLLIIFVLAYTVYFIAAMIYEFGDESSIRLFVGSILGYLIVLRGPIKFGLKKLNLKTAVGKRVDPKTIKFIMVVRFIIRWALYLVLIGFMVYVLIEQGRDDLDNLAGIPGLFIMMFICLLFSTKPEKINWHTIIWSIGLQFLFAYCVLKQSFGRDAMEWVQDRTHEFYNSGRPAFRLLFGDNYMNMGLVFNSFPFAFMMGATLTALYYVGALPMIIYVIGSILSFIMEVGFIETMSVAGGIFIEGPLAILSLRPFLLSQSKSQLFTIVTSTLASLGLTYMAILALYNISLVHIIPAMLISAPATFTVCKLMVPETRIKDDKRKRDELVGLQESHANFLDAFQSGSILALPVVGNLIAIAFAYTCGIEWLNVTFEWFGNRVGKSGFTMEYVFSYLLYPVALAMGIRTSECRRAAKVLGIRFISSSLLGMVELETFSAQKEAYNNYLRATNFTGPIMHDGDDIILVLYGARLKDGFISDRTEAILTYSLSGMSSIVSLGLTFGALYAFLPQRRTWLIKMAFPALIAGNIANYMTGCFAGLFFE